MSIENNHKSTAAGTTAEAINSTTTANPTEMSQVQSEVDNAPSSTHERVVEPTSRDTTSSDVPRTPPGPVRTDTTTALAQALAAPSDAPPATVLVPPSNRTRSQSTAIGPSTDQVDPIIKEEDQSSPKLELTLLLTNGARHPFLIDSKYLAKRNVTVQEDDPFNLSVYKLKELILREWRDEWEQKPSSPSYIRLISFGKLLDDKTAIKGKKMPQIVRSTANIGYSRLEIQSNREKRCSYDH